MSDGEPVEREGLSSSPIGKILDGWLLQETLGSGGMGTVFRATHTKSGLVAALKVIRALPDSSVDALKRSRREVQALARLEHPAVVRILQEALDHSPPYFCMEILPGGSLSARIKQAAAEALPGQSILDPEWLANLAQELAEGLAVVHGARILHRDIKPQNILFTVDGQAKLSDFGLAKIQDATAMTAPNQRMGSIPYMAPEALRAEGFSERSDLYQLGATLFDAATGHPPYGAEQLLCAVRHEPLPPLPDLTQLAPVLTARLPWFAPMVERLMADSPDDRFPSAAELAAHIDEQRLRGAQAGEQPTVHAHGFRRSRTALPAAEQRPIAVAHKRSARGGRRLRALVIAASAVSWTLCIAAVASRLLRPDGLRNPTAAESSAAPEEAGERLERPPFVSVGTTSIRLQCDTPLPSGARFEFHAAGSSSGRTRILTAASSNPLFDGLMDDTEYLGDLVEASRRTPVSFRTLRKASTPGSVLLLRESGDINDPKLAASGEHVVALWKRSVPPAGTNRLEVSQSLDGGQTWSAPELLALAIGDLYSLVLSVGPSDATAGWREGELGAPGGQVCVRRWSREKRDWSQTLRTEVGVSLDGLGIVRRAGGLDLLAVVAASEVATGRALARARLPDEQASLSRFQPVLALPPDTSGSLQLAFQQDALMVAIDERRADRSWDVAWTLADMGDSPI
ncbi:MAG: serine/threonine protein kinase, partial [Candidatus Wallbacteria bacterium]|nr:serine/threonine protein kinase [Candidatus Wallbacteria bacterium]